MRLSSRRGASSTVVIIIVLVVVCGIGALVVLSATSLHLFRLLPFHLFHFFRTHA